jgi:hypothetical protein
MSERRRKNGAEVAWKGIMGFFRREGKREGK